jgi:adenosylhomocysteinase
MGYTLSNGNTLYVIAGGRLVNLASGDGHPAEIMDMSFAIQALSVLYLATNRDKIKNKVVPVPEEIDNEVAMRKLKFLGIELDVLTDEQKKYLSM